MKLRLRTLITGSKTVEHAKYNLSFQLTADAIGYLRPVATAAEQPNRQWVTAEAYTLNDKDRERITELLREMAEISPRLTNLIGEIKHVIGIIEVDVDAGMQDSFGWNE